MNKKLAIGVATWLLASFSMSLPSQQPCQDERESYLLWTASQAEAVGKSGYAKGRVGGGRTLLTTERSHDYKLAATWLTPEVIRASARLVQLRSRLSNEETRALVAEAEAAGDTVVMVEIDPREGSGVIPLEWEGFLQPKGTKSGLAGSVSGTKNPGLRNVQALAGVLRRNYDYDRFWLVFPLANEAGEPIFSSSTREAELVVRIYNKEGRVSWPIPESIRCRITSNVRSAN